MPSVPGLSSGFAHGTPRGPTVGAVMSLEVETTFLACVENSTWHDADVEMRKIACRARGSHALFHVKQLHGFDLVYRSYSMDWITGLPPCGPMGYNSVFTVVNRTTQQVRILPCVLGAGEMSSEDRKSVV